MLDTTRPPSVCQGLTSLAAAVHPTLEAAKPHLAAQWDHERNPPTLSPATVTLGSNRAVWWYALPDPCLQDLGLAV